MSQIKISQLPVLSTMTDSATVPVVAADTTQQISGANLKTYFTSNIADLSVGNIVVTTQLSASGITSSDDIAMRAANDFAIITDNGGNDTEWYFSAAGTLTAPGSVTTTVGGANLVFGSATSTALPGISSTTSVTLTANRDGTAKSMTLFSTGDISAPGNLSVSNITASTVSASGNVTGGNIITNGFIELANGAVIQDSIGNAVAFGTDAGASTQGAGAVAIGFQSGSSSQGANAIAIGTNAGKTTQGTQSVAIGISAGNAQGVSAVAIGAAAGSIAQGAESVAIGKTAGEQSQGAYSVALGVGAAYYQQGIGAVAIGTSAGAISQGGNAIAIGTGAGAGAQPANSIIINATGDTLDGTNSGLYIAPIRNDVANIGEIVFYNTTSKEITYSNTISIAGNIESSGNFSATGNTFTFDLGAGTITANASTFGYSGASPSPIISGFAGANIIGNITGGNISATGNVTAGNVSTTGLVDSYDINAANSITVGNDLSVTGDISGAYVSATGNIAGGNLIVTGTVYGQVANVVTGFETAGYVTAIRVITDPQPLANLTAVAGGRAFVNDGNLVAAGNFGAQVSGSGANTVPVWSDGANWYIG